MNLETIARAYTHCIELEERAQHDSPLLAEDLSVLRADLHALMMQVLRDTGIPFTDRADAARIAYDILQGKQKTA